MELGMVHWRWFHALVNIEPGLDKQDCYDENFGFSRAYATRVGVGVGVAGREIILCTYSANWGLPRCLICSVP